MPSVTSLALFKTLEKDGCNIRQLEFRAGHYLDARHLAAMPTVLGRITSLTLSPLGGLSLLNGLSFFSLVKMQNLRGGIKKDSVNMMRQLRLLAKILLIR